MGVKLYPNLRSSDSLKLAAWNVHGLGSKMDDSEFVNTLLSFDICFLQETWCTQKFTVPGKYVFCKHAVKNNNSGGRYSGGIAVVISEKLKQGIKIMKSCEYGIWIKLDKKCFNIDSNVYVCGLYLHPINSPYASKSPYEAIERDITDCYSDGDILLVGDTNSRTAELCDFIKPDKYDELLNVNCSSVQYEELPERFNIDCVYNSMGKQLIEFCTNSNTYIVNGRTKGDIPGKMTCIQHAGCSTVDYAIASFKLKECIRYFNVSAFNEFSDHALIKICIDITCLLYTSDAADDRPRV